MGKMRRICGIQELECSGLKGGWVANKPLRKVAGAWMVLIDIGEARRV